MRCSRRAAPQRILSKRYGWKDRLQNDPFSVKCDLPTFIIDLNSIKLVMFPAAVVAMEQMYVYVIQLSRVV